MSALEQGRADLAQLVDGVQVTVPGFGAITVPTVSVTPEDATPPLIMTGPAEPYVDFEDADFGEKRGHYVAVAVGEGVNEAAASQVDDMITACLVRLLAEGSSFDVDQVDRPGKITLNGQSHLGVVIRVSRTSAIAD